jgi:hypothetical protein
MNLVPDESVDKGNSRIVRHGELDDNRPCEEAHRSNRIDVNVSKTSHFLCDYGEQDTAEPIAGLFGSLHMVPWLKAHVTIGRSAKSGWLHWPLPEAA